MMKRELGENPGQTRCCKLCKSFKHTLATVIAIYGKAFEERVSQKTCQDDLSLILSGYKLSDDQLSFNQENTR